MINDKLSSRSRPRLLFLFCFCIVLITQSCASTPEIQPKSIVTAEQYLQMGTEAFYNDEYRKAAANFSKVIKIYQSIDNLPGIMTGYINLIESEIAVGKFVKAHDYLNQLNNLQDTDPRKLYTGRIILLRVKLAFNEKKYSQAFSDIQKLLPTFDENQKITEKNTDTLSILSSMARLTVTTNSKNPALWLERFRHEIEQREMKNDRYTALLLRLQAKQLQEKNNFKESKAMLTKALHILHQKAYRRGIAACLQQLAMLEIAQQHWRQAENYLQRALRIHLWTLNHRNTIHVLEKLIEINHRLGKNALANSFERQLNKLKKKPK